MSYGYGCVVGYGIAGATERCEDLCVKWSVHGVRDCMIWKLLVEVICGDSLCSRRRVRDEPGAQIPLPKCGRGAEVSAIFSLGCCEVAQASSVHLGRSRCVGAAELLSTLV